MRLFVFFSSLVMILATSGCLFHSKKQPKSESHIYGGDAPTIRYNTENERAGGALNTY